MKLQHLFAVIPGLPENLFPAMEVSGVFNDARKVTPGSVFVAIKGQKSDGHQFIPDAIRNGAVALVLSDRSLVPADFQGFIVEVADGRAALDLLASRFHWDPGRDLFCAGVTGTNGKTSTTYMIEAILNRGALPTGVIGTVNHHLRSQVWPSDMTTPDPVFLQQRLREFREDGAAAVAIEVSSHALDQHRVDSVPFNAVVFTNLTRDHLDYHQTIEAYFAAKQRLFLDLLWKTGKHPSFAIVNTDDPWGRRLRIADPALLWTYGFQDADFRARILTREFARTVFELRTPIGRIEVDLPMGGDHNVLNATAALLTGLAAEVDLDMGAKALREFAGVPGRLQSVPNDRGLTVFVDYAHTPDALDNVLGTLNRVRAVTKSSGKIWTVFGCGGDRDKGKRPLMATAALNGSDQVIITSDNPRTEDPEAIIKDIRTGVSTKDNSRVQVEADRRRALALALNEARSGDVVLIAGKGHEDYQIIGNEKKNFSDAAVAAEILAGGS